METDRFDVITQRLAGSVSRRRSLGLLATLGLPGLVPRDAAAAKKKSCPPCKRRKQGKCKKNKPDGTTCAGGTCLSGSCIAVSDAPPPPSPPTGPGSCTFDGGGGFGSARRFAQTFLPPQGGHITTATVFLMLNSINYSLTFEIRLLDSLGIPSNSILGTATVRNIPATSFSGPPRAVTGTFTTPVPITVGQQYALVVTGPDVQYAIFGSATNPCQDGKLFFDNNASGAFAVDQGGISDLAFSLTLV